MRQFHDTACLVPHRCYIAHLGAGNQPLILWVIPGDGVKQINIFRRRQTFNLEVAQTPQVQSLGHHRMQATIELLFFISVLVEAIGKVLHAASALSVGTGDFHHDAPDRTWQARLIEHRLNFLLCDFSIGQLSRMPGVDVDNDLTARRHFLDQRRHREQHLGET